MGKIEQYTEQRQILCKCGMGHLDDSHLPEWGWSAWTPIVEKLLERIEALEKRFAEMETL